MAKFVQRHSFDCFLNFGFSFPPYLFDICTTELLQVIDPIFFLSKYFSLAFLKIAYLFKCNKTATICLHFPPAPALQEQVQI
jgi:hypothetical protein